MNIKEDQYVTAPTVARMAGMTERNLHYLRAKGQTPEPISLGNRFFYPRDEAERWAKARKAGKDAR